MYPLTVDEQSNSSHVVLQVLTDVREKVVVGVQMTNDLIAIVKLIGAVMVDIVHWRLERQGVGERGEREGGVGERGRRGGREVWGESGRGEGGEKGREGEREGEEEGRE